VTTNDAGEYDIPALFYGTYAVRTMIPGVGMRGRVLTLTKDKLEVKLNPDDSTRQPGFNLPPAPRMPNILPRLAPPGMRWHWRLLPPILPNGGQRQQQTPDHDNPGEQTARPA
jgi:hypothetical protein